MIDHLNINFVRNKFDSLIEIIKSCNIFLISESKLDIYQFKINGNKHGGGSMFYISEGIALSFYGSNCIA